MLKPIKKASPILLLLSFFLLCSAPVSSQLMQFEAPLSHLYQDELDEFLHDYKHIQESMFCNSSHYFVRCENVSLKYGQHGIGPYHSLKMIIESLVSCIEGHKPIYHDTTYIVVYLLPFIPMEPHKEFRVFVHNNRITAISQQDVHSVFKELNDNVITEYYKIVSEYFYQNINYLITEKQNYTYDFVILPDGKPYFIEMNSFGPQYAAGSALFHWITDYDLLHQDICNPKVYFRYTI